MGESVKMSNDTGKHRKTQRRGQKVKAYLKITDTQLYNDISYAGEC